MKLRPRRIGIPRISKYSGETSLYAVLMVGPFSARLVMVGTAPLSGTEEAAAIVSTAGSEARASITRLRLFSTTSIAITLLVRKPISNALIAMVVRTSAPHATNKSVQTVICAITSAFRTRTGLKSEVNSPRTEDITLARVAWNAGARPKSNAEARAAKTMNAITRQSTGRGTSWINSSMSFGMVANITRMAASIVTREMMNPRMAAGIERRMLSVRSWRIRRLRRAPRERRIPISRCRAVARASIMLATFVHANTSTRPKATTSGLNAISSSGVSGIEVAFECKRIPAALRPSGS